MYHIKKEQQIKLETMSAIFMRIMETLKLPIKQNSYEKITEKFGMTLTVLYYGETSEMNVVEEP